MTAGGLATPPGPELHRHALRPQIALTLALAVMLPGLALAVPAAAALLIRSAFGVHPVLGAAWALATGAAAAAVGGAVVLAVRHRPGPLRGADRVLVGREICAATLHRTPPTRVVVDGGADLRLIPGRRRELVIGYPLLVGLSPAELRARLARELAFGAGSGPAGLGAVVRIVRRLEYLPVSTSGCPGRERPSRRMLTG
jgi:hypothetical protein